MGCPEQVQLGDTLPIAVTTHDPDTARLSDAESEPEYRIYDDSFEQVWPEDGSAGEMAVIDDGNTTGFYGATVGVTADNGFVAGKIYTVLVVATVDGDPGGVTWSFRVGLNVGGGVNLSTEGTNLSSED